MFNDTFNDPVFAGRITALQHDENLLSAMYEVLL
jgi:hypothetical protein